MLGYIYNRSILPTDRRTFCTCNSAKYTWPSSAFRIPHSQSILTRAKLQNHGGNSATEKAEIPPRNELDIWYVGGSSAVRKLLNLQNFCHTLPLYGVLFATIAEIQLQCPQHSHSWPWVICGPADWPTGILRTKSKRTIAADQWTAKSRKFAYSSGLVVNYTAILIQC